MDRTAWHGFFIDSWLRHVETVSKLELRGIRLSTRKAILDSLRWRWELSRWGAKVVSSTVTWSGHGRPIFGVLFSLEWWCLLGDLTTLIIFESQLVFNDELLMSISLLAVGCGIGSSDEGKMIVRNSQYFGKSKSSFQTGRNFMFWSGWVRGLLSSPNTPNETGIFPYLSQIAEVDNVRHAWASLWKI